MAVSLCCSTANALGGITSRGSNLGITGRHRRAANMRATALLLALAANNGGAIAARQARPPHSTRQQPSEHARHQQQELQAPAGATRAARPAREGYVSSTHRDATLAGVQILEAGGNSADAAAAVQFALAVVQPQSTGIGGGCFVMRRDGATGEVTALDGREEAPGLFHPNVFCADDDCLLDPECACTEGPVRAPSARPLSPRSARTILAMVTRAGRCVVCLPQIPAGERQIGGLSAGVPGSHRQWVGIVILP